MMRTKQWVESLLKQARQKAGNKDASSSHPARVWSHLQTLLHPTDIPLEVHMECYKQVYASSSSSSNDGIHPTWIPSSDIIQSSNIYKMMQQQGMTNYEDFYQWSITDREAFWKASIDAIDIQWRQPPTAVFDYTYSTRDSSTYGGGSGNIDHSPSSEDDPSQITYFPNGVLNITESLFHKRSPNDAAIIYASDDAPTNLKEISFGQLDAESNQIAHALLYKLGLERGDRVVICLPMIPQALSVYIGIVKAGGVVVSVADSFSAEEIAIRCNITQPKVVITQDGLTRGGKHLPLYPRVVEAVELSKRMGKRDVDTGKYIVDEDDEDAKETKSDDCGAASDLNDPTILVLAANQQQQQEEGSKDDLHSSVQLRDNDLSFSTFLENANRNFVSIPCSSMDPCNILFSSGTTGEPKAIVWSHSTPIKCAVDGYYHQNIKVGERVAWPTNMGWMMGPWLLFQMTNGATITLLTGLTTTKAFCQFVQAAQVDMLGVIPSLAQAWQASNALDGCDWSCISRFSSTGEASDSNNYFWLASRVPGYAPIIEYCGGTEIGGGFLSSTMVQPNVPSMFSTPALGSQVVLLDHNDESNLVDDSSKNKSGEIALGPPAIGLSTRMLNRNHYDTYYKNMPKGPNGTTLRRHGDEIEVLTTDAIITDNATTTTTTTTTGGKRSKYYRALGRSDDTMKLGGIKVGSVEIERVCNLLDQVQETAAIAVSQGGPSELVVFVVLKEGQEKKSQEDLKAAMQTSIKLHLNPLFHIHDVVLKESLPRTATNKVMRRVLRDEYMETWKQQ